MAKLRCVCGHIIVDQTDNLPYKAYFLSDKDEETCFETVANQIREFILAREHGRAREAFAAFLQPNDGDLDAVNALMFVQVIFMRNMYECEICGRLLIELNKNKYVSYAPEENFRGIFHSVENE